MAGSAGGANPVSLVFQFGTAALKLKTASKRKKAKRLLKQLQRARISAKRREFMRQFRAAQQQQLIAGTREGGLESSAFQGQRASLKTQGGLKFGEFEDQTKKNLQAELLVSQADSLDASLDFFNDLAQGTKGL